MSEEAGASDMGFKRLTAANWLEPDPTNQAFVVWGGGNFRDMAPSDVAAKVLAPQLVSSVPRSVVQLFEVGRGAMLYGWFFYPLYTLGMEQLFRVGEAALAARCAELNAPAEVVRFVQRIDWLASQDILTRRDRMRWHAMRELRNAASHPDEQNIYPPGLAMGSIQNVADLINALYG